MTNQARASWVLILLVASMTLGAMVLMGLDNHSLSAGVFSLASYTDLNPIDKLSSNLVSHNFRPWNRIEVCYSNTACGNIEQLAALEGLSESTDINFHFVVCNGTGAVDGLIEATEKWRTQRPCFPGGNWYGTSQTLRICVIADGIKTMPTDSQIKRTAKLVESLRRKISISQKQISYPVNWQL